MPPVTILLPTPLPFLPDCSMHRPEFVRAARNGGVLSEDVADLFVMTQVDATTWRVEWA